MKTPACIITLLLFSISIHSREYSRFALFAGAGMYYPGPALLEPYEDPGFLASGIGGHIELHVRTTTRTKVTAAFSYYGLDRSRMFGGGAEGTGIHPSLSFDYLLFEPGRFFAASIGGQLSYVHETIDFEYPSGGWSLYVGGSSTPHTGTDTYDMFGGGPLVELRILKCINIRASVPWMIPVSATREFDSLQPENDTAIQPKAAFAPRFSIGLGWGF